MNFTTTDMEGWQKDCWAWSKARKPFKLHAVKGKHVVLCEELAAAYQYRFSLNDSVATFLPENVALLSQPLFESWPVKTLIRQSCYG